MTHMGNRSTYVSVYTANNMTVAMADCWTICKLIDQSVHVAMHIIRRGSTSDFSGVVVKIVECTVTGECHAPTKQAVCAVRRHRTHVWCMIFAIAFTRAFFSIQVLV